MSYLKRILVSLVFLLPFIGKAQVPAAPSNGLWGIIASQYQVGTTAQGAVEYPIAAAASLLFVITI